jgi:hypothetical protein
MPPRFYRDPPRSLCEGDRYGDGKAAAGGRLYGYLARNEPPSAKPSFSKFARLSLRFEDDQGDPFDIEPPS